MSTTVTNPTSPWVVPAGVTSISITVCAAGGGGGNGDDGTTGSDLSIASAVFGGIFHCYGGAGGGIDGNGADGDVTFGSGWSGLAGGADNGGAGDDGSGGSGGKIWNNALAVTAGQSFTYGTDTSGTNGQLPDVGVGAGGANDGGPGSVVIVYSIGGGSTSVVAGATGKAVAAAQAIVKELMATGSAGVGKVTGALAVNAIIPPMNASVVGAGQEIATPIVKEPLAADVAGVAALHGVLSVAGSQITATAQMLGLAAANAALSVFSPLVLTNVVPPQTALLLTGEDAVALGKTEVFQQIDQRIRWVQDGARFTGANAFATNTWMAFDDTLDFRIEAEVSMDVGSHDCSPLFMYWSEAYYRRIDFYQTDVGVDDHDYRYGIGDWGMGQTLALELGQHVCIAFEFIAATRTLTSYYKYPTDSEWTLGHASVPYWPAVVPDDLPAPLIGCWDWGGDAVVGLYSFTAVRGSLRSISINPNRSAGFQSRSLVTTQNVAVGAASDSRGYYTQSNPSIPAKVYGPLTSDEIVTEVWAVAVLDPGVAPNYVPIGQPGRITAQWQDANGTLIGSPAVLSDGTQAIPVLGQGSVRLVFTLTAPNGQAPLLVAFDELMAAGNFVAGTYQLDAGPIGSADMNAALGNLFALVATSKAAAIATANLAEADPVQAAATALGISNAAMQVLVGMAASADGTAIENAAMQVNVPLNAHGTGTATDTTNLVGLLSLAADTIGVGAENATLGETMQGSANVTGAGKASAFLESLIPLVGQATGDAQTQGTLTQTTAATILGAAIALGAGGANAALTYLLPMLAVGDGEGIAHAVLEAVSGTHEVYHTQIHGTMTIEIDPLGNMASETFTPDVTTDALN